MFRIHDLMLPLKSVLQENNKSGRDFMMKANVGKSHLMKAK